MSKHKTVARLQAIATARDEALSIVREAKAAAIARNDDYARVALERHLLSSVGMGLGVSVVVPRSAFERTCIGCGAKVIPGLTDHCNH